MPLPDSTGWVSQQQLNQIPGQPPPEVIAAMQGRYDPSVHQWNQQTMTLTGPEGEYYFGGDTHNPYAANPENGTNVVIDGVTQNFAQGVTPYTFLGGGQAQTVAEGSPEYHALRDDARTRNQQGLARIATLVGGGAALGATGSGPVFGGSSAAGTTAAQTFPYNAGGPVTATPLAGAGAATAAGGAAAAGGGGAANALGAGGAVASNIPDWVGNYLLPGLNTLLGTRAADQATDAQVAAMDRAIAENQRQFDTTRNDLMPWLDAGRDALGQLNNPSNYFTQSPDYTFRRDEGTRGIENSFAARGGGQSGNALRALSEFNSGLASQEYGDWWNRQAGRAGVGQTTATQLGQLGANAAANTGNYMQNQGTARASGVLGKYGSVANGINDGFYNYLYRRRA